MDQPPTDDAKELSRAVNLRPAWRREMTGRGWTEKRIDTAARELKLMPEVLEGVA